MSLLHTIALKSHFHFQIAFLILCSHTFTYIQYCVNNPFNKPVKRIHYMLLASKFATFCFRLSLVFFFFSFLPFLSLFHPIRSPFPDYHKLNEDGELWLVYEGLKETNRLKSREIRACRNVLYLPKHCLQNALLNIWVVLHGIKTCKKELFVKC